MVAKVAKPCGRLRERGESLSRIRSRSRSLTGIESASDVSGRRVAAAQKAARTRWAQRGSLIALISASVDTSAGPDGCWPWTGSTNDDGYGRVFFRGKSIQSHKAVLEAVLGRGLAPGEVTRHKCVGNRLCCNWRHLRPGTIADNNRDTVEHGRTTMGERNPGHRLTTAQAAEIRAIATPGRYEEIGRRFGVSGKTVSNIARGLRWAGALAEPAAAKAVLS